jgi:hypothetical protein
MNIGILQKKVIASRVDECTKQTWSKFSICMDGNLRLKYRVLDSKMAGYVDLPHRIWVSTMAVFACVRPVIRSNSQQVLSFLFQSIATQAPRPLLGFRAHIALQSVGLGLLGTLVAPTYLWFTITRHPFVQDAAADKSGEKLYVF